MSSVGGGNKPRHTRQRSSSRRDGDDKERGERGERSQTNQLRRQAAISLSSFSSKKGHDRALQEYKKRKETNFNKNAVLLRQYQRAMKSEGYEVGKGASRKRDRSERGNTTRSLKQSHDAEEDRADQVESHEKKRKRHKSDPLYQARRKAEQRKAELQDKAQQKQERMLDEGQKQSNRKKTARKYLQRTKRGQPVMKNVISGMLDKIQNGSS